MTVQSRETLTSPWLWAALAVPLFALANKGALTNWISGASKGSADIETQLKPQLSAGATILSPKNEKEWDAANERWSLYSKPTFRAIVEVETEEDIQATVKWANSYGVPFLALGGHHGTNKALAGIQNGIGISTKKMKTISLSDDGSYATLAPGLKTGELVRALFKLGKRTCTGSCLCTGIIGPLLGGGHGFLQGQLGLMVDNLLEARLILADGSAITVNATNEHKELFWALKGAGHNFGIVSSVKVKVYDQPERDWSTLSIVYSGEQVEKVFEASNEFNKSVVPEITNFIVMRRIPPADPKNAIILSKFFFDGPMSELEKHAAPYLNVPCIFKKGGSGNYVEIFSIGQSDEKAPQCLCNDFKNILGAELAGPQNAKSMVEVYKEFDAFLKANPAAFNSNVIFERYGDEAVAAVAEHTTAVPSRKSLIHASPQMIYKDPSITPQAVAMGKKIRDLLQRGIEKPSAYLNYAFGDEDLKQVYGYENWRLQTLRELKKRYDPEGRFKFYVPF